MKNEDFQTHELEHDIQRFMQVREQIHSEVNKIGAHVRTLEETNKRLIAHFDVFEKMSEQAQSDISKSIKAGAREMGHAAAEDFSQIIKGVLAHRLTELSQAAENARAILDTTMGEEFRQLVKFGTIGSLLIGLAAFGWGRLSAPSPTSSTLSETCLHTLDLLCIKMDDIALKMEGGKKKK